MNVNSPTVNSLLKEKARGKKSEATLITIIRAGTSCFATNGFSATTIADIAKKANLSVGAIYRYFDTKLELYRAVINKMQDTIREANREAIKNCKTRYEKEHEGMKAWLNIVKEHPDVYRLIWESLYIDQSLFNDYYSSFGKGYADSLKKDSNELIENDYDNVAFFLIGLNTFIGVKLLLEGKEITDEEIDQIADSAIKFLKEGLLK